MVARSKVAAVEEVEEVEEDAVEALEDPDADEVEELVEPPKPAAKKKAALKSVPAAAASEGTPADIRAWAAGNGLTVSARGRIRQDLRDAFENDDVSLYLGDEYKPAPAAKVAAAAVATVASEAAPAKKRGRPAGSKNVSISNGSNGNVASRTPVTVTSAGPGVLVEEVDGKIFIKLGNRVYAAKQLFV